VFKLYYCLQIVDALLQNNYTEVTLTNSICYREMFISCGGLAHLIGILMNTDFVATSSSDQGSSKKLVCLALVLRITLSLLGTENNKINYGTFQRVELYLLSDRAATRNWGGHFRASWKTNGGTSLNRADVRPRAATGTPKTLNASHFLRKCRSRSNLRI
jgi:hypothetical protein